MFKVLFGAFPYVVYILLAWTFLSPSLVGTRRRAIGMMVLLVCAAKFTVFAALGGNAFAPELPECLIQAWNFAYSGMMILFALSLAGQVVRFMLKRLAGRDVPRLVWFVALPLVAWGVSARGVWNGTKLPEVREIELAFDNLPEELDGYRIAHLTDIHASAAARRWRTQAIVEMTNALGADLICLTGDYSDGDSNRQIENVEPLARLHAKDGVLAVTGNHEYYYDAFNWMQYYFSMTNMEVLVNRCVFPRKGLAVGGVNDIAAEDVGFAPPSVGRAFAAATNGEFRVLLQHRPHVVVTGEVEYVRYDLQLSGHTHGGVAPILDWLVKKANGGMVRGAYPGSGDKPVVFVSEGAGQWAGFPIRFFDDPVIAVITLRRRASE